MSGALIAALNANDVDCLAKLLAAGEDPKPPFKPGYTYTPLDAAVGLLQNVGSGRVPISVDAVVLLLRYGADVNAWDEPHTTTPLLTAVTDNQTEALRLLLAVGADPNVWNLDGESPLCMCAWSGRLEMARLLLQCGATKTIHHSGGLAGMSALGFAATELDIEMVKLLLAYGADPNVPDIDRMTVLDHLRWFPPASKPETPEKWERLQEIRRLLGAPPLVRKEP